MSRIFAIIPAAGLGVRFGGKKQEALLRGKTLVERIVSVFKETNIFEAIVLVGESPPMNAGGRGDLKIVEGGKTRAESVSNGFKSLNTAEDDIVLIHDAARPLVSPALIQRVIAAVKERGAVVPVISVSDTVKKTVEGRVVGTVDRKELALAQTPQGFRAGFLKKAYAKVPVSEEVTDEAKLLELAGLPVFTVEGEKNNIKITTPEDLLLAECFLTMDLNKDYI